MSDASTFRPCIVIPVYNHEGAVATVIARLSTNALPIILVDDGSDEACRLELLRLSEQDDALTLIRLPENRGKGGAVKAGLIEAARQGYSHALQVDADGQHDVQFVDAFLAAGQRQRTALICGYPVFDDSVPRLRYYARYLTHVWVWINSLSLQIKDSMCGFRLYPLRESVALIEQERTGNRMEFDPEVMVRWVWRGHAVVNLSIRVCYPIDGVSHFLAWRDNLLISKMHARLFFGMLLRLPVLLARKLRPAVTSHG